METQYDFLDEKANLIVNDFRKNNIEQYKLIFSICELMDKIMNDEDCKKYTDKREEYIIGTIFDCYTTYSSEILLLERGLVSDFCVLLRTFYEKKFKLFAVIKDKKNYTKVELEGNAFHNDLITQIINNKKNMFDNIIEELDKEVYDFNTYEGKKTSVESWANAASLNSEYETQYSVLSEKTHYGIGSLIEKLNNNEDDKVTYLSFDYTGFNENLFAASYEMIKCIRKFLQFFNCETYNNRIIRIEEQLIKIVKQIEQ